jgi:uncharacterized membrane protein
MMGREYTTHGWLAWWLAALVACFVLTAIVPPFQAPDEIDHVRRAALLADGQLLLQQRGGAASGGQVDTGLETYAQRMFPLGITLDKRMDAGEVAGLTAVRWSGQKKMVYPTGTSYYFPALYLPQAVGLAIGRHMGWTVGASYLLARFLALGSAMALLAFAFRLYAPPPLAMALLSLPMQLYLMSGAVLDGMSTAVAVVGLSAYMRLFTDGTRSPRWVVWVLLTSIVLVTSCRANMLPFLVLPLAAWFVIRDRRILWMAVAAVVLVLAWTLFAIKYTVYPEGAARGGHGGKLLGYLTHPGQFFGPFFETLTRAHMRQFLGWSFVGILGWLTVALPAWTYPLIGMLLVLLLVLGISRDVVRTFPGARMLLVVGAVAATLLAFLALLVQWPQAEEGVINGVQGRYLLIPALAVAYALSGTSGWMPVLRHRSALAIVAVLMGIGLFTAIGALIGRYYLDPVRVHQDAAVVGTQLTPSAQLSRGQSIPLHFDEAQRAEPRHLVRLGIDMATYARENQGRAVLRLRTVDGTTSEYAVDLPTLADNTYTEFLLDGRPYVGGDLILTEGGGGISVWEARAPNGTTMTCLMYAARDDDYAVLTPACPAPRRL